MHPLYAACNNWANKPWGPVYRGAVKKPPKKLHDEGRAFTVDQREHPEASGRVQELRKSRRLNMARAGEVGSGKITWIIGKMRRCGEGSLCTQ